VECYGPTSFAECRMFNDVPYSIAAKTLQVVLMENQVKYFSTRYGWVSNKIMANCMIHVYTTYPLIILGNILGLYPKYFSIWSPERYKQITWVDNIFNLFQISIHVI
jgi:hypothetical protein